jgi:hypothetical protein
MSVLFFTKYDADKNAFGGMVRVKDVEKKFQRVCFLRVFYLNPFVCLKSKSNTDGEVYVIGFLRIWKIFSLIRSAKICYIHTVGNFIRAFPYLCFVSNSKLVLDTHGAQPEEFIYSNEYFKSLLFGFFEYVAFRKIKRMVYVSVGMKRHFNGKYRGIREELVYPINASVRRSSGDLEKDRVNACARLGMDPAGKIVLYSGGLQPWQCIEDVKRFFASICNLRGVQLVFLTPYVDDAKKLLSGIEGNVKICFASGDELKDYYLAADYGVIFREGSVVNEVACPTKLIEYLQFGLVPVLTTPLVGDINLMASNKIIMTNFEAEYLRRGKSMENVLSVNKYLDSYPFRIGDC